MVYTNATAVAEKKHGMFESSRIKETNHLYDALVQNSGANVAVDNGVAIKIGDFTGNGLQEVKATIAAIGDKIAVVGAPALVKDATTKAGAAAYNFEVPAGTLAKAYEIGAEDIFAIAEYQFEDATKAVVGNYVIVSGTGTWKAQTSAPGATYGFVGKVHSVVVGSYGTVMVRVLTVKNEAVTA